MNNHWQNFVRVAFKSLLALLRFVPWKTACKWGESLGLLGYKLVPRYRAVAERNLRLAYGDELTDQQRDQIVRGVFRNFGRATFEFLKAPYLTPDEVRHLVPIDDFGHAQPAYERGKGMIVITGHLGNWELIARRVALEGYKLLVVARPSKDTGFNDLTDHIRKNAGYIVHARGGSIRPLVEKLKEGGLVAILPDQKSDDIFLPFFGKTAGTVAGPAVLALKTGAPIIPFFCPRLPDGTFKLVIGDEIDTHSTGDHAADVLRIMAAINCSIETVIRQYPDQWLWLHDRWLIRPPRRRGRAQPAPEPEVT